MGGEAGFGVGDGQQALRHLAPKFRLQEYFLFGGGAFICGELVAVENID